MEIADDRRAMKTSTGATEVITAYLDAVSKKDASVVDRTFHPDIEYRVNMPVSMECGAALPWLGSYHGRDELKAFLKHLHRNLDITEFGPFSIVADGDKGAVFSTFRLQALSTGRTAEIPFAVYFEVRDGLIAKYHFIENSFDVAAAFRSSLSIEVFTSSEAGSWSNAYLISGKDETVLFDTCMLCSDAMKLAEAIEATGKTLRAILISHAHPDHFMALDVLSERFPNAPIVSTANVLDDVRTDGPWMLSIVQQRLGEEAPHRLVVPAELPERVVRLDDATLNVVEFGEGESRHIAAIHIPKLRALLCADLIYNGAHAYLQERHLDGWMERLEELETFVRENDVATIYPGHGSPGRIELIEKTRAYLRDFEDAIALGDPKRAEEYMLAKYPDYHAKPFLTAFSIPAYFPSAVSS